MYRASDAKEYQASLETIEAVATDLGLDATTIATARDLFLTVAPDDSRSESALAAASLYAATLLTGDHRAQGTIAEAFGVSRLSVQSNWKSLVEAAGFDAPSW